MYACYNLDFPCRLAKGSLSGSCCNDYIHPALSTSDINKSTLTVGDVSPEVFPAYQKEKPSNDDEEKSDI